MPRRAAALLLLPLFASPAGAVAASAALGEAIEHTESQRRGAGHHHHRHHHAGGASAAGGHTAHASPGTQDLVSSLNKIAKSLEQEQDSSKALTNTRDKECQSQLGEYGAPKKAIRDGERLIEQSTEELQNINADADAVQSGIDGLNDKIDDAKNRIGSLTQQLKDLRNSQKASDGQAVTSLQQLDKVIAQAQWQEEHQRHRSAESARHMNSEVSDLRRLGRQLSSGLSFLQATSAHTEAGAGGESVSVLQSDRKELLHARKVANKGFQEEEARIIDLIKEQRKQLVKFESDLAEQRPILSDRLKRAAEVNRTISMAGRVLRRDTESLDLTKKVCDLQSENGINLNKIRANLIGLVKMPAVLLEKMDIASFLERDLRDLKVAPSFVQTGETVELGQAVQDALQAAEASSQGFSDDSASSSDGSDRSSAASSSSSGSNSGALLQQGTSGGAGAGDASSGPFDKVIGMIKGLITNLRDQATEDTNLHQWCADSKAENDRNRIEGKRSETTASAQILWAQNAILELDEQVKFFEAELPRLQQEKQQVQSYFNSEKDLLSGQKTAHEGHRAAFKSTLQALEGLCSLNLGSDIQALSLVQTSSPGARAVLAQNAKSKAASEAKQLTKQGQCEEAASLIAQAGAKLSELDSAIDGYLTAYSSQTESKVQACTTAINQREGDLNAAKAARGKRANDLAIAEGDKKQTVESLSLIEEASRSIEQKCSVKETHEERMARRADEIDSLKSAYKVLNGEEIPVGGSFLSTGSNGGARGQAQAS